MMKIVFTGGGTLGSVTPLLALYEELQHNSSQPPLILRGGEVGLKAFWIGTMGGVEREIIATVAIPFFSIFSGKWRRYVDWRTIFAPLETLLGFLQSVVLLFRLRPTHVIGAGGYVAVPVLWAAWLLRIHCYTLQLDVRPGLANRLVAPFVTKIFVAFEESVRWFPQEKVVVTGAPVRKGVSECQSIRVSEHLTLLVLGGGTGALYLNELIVSALPELTKLCRVVHITGKSKIVDCTPRLRSGQEFQISESLYRCVEFISEELFSLYTEADLVLTRAGMGVLSELSALSKPAIVVPLPDTAQEENAAMLARHNAAVVVAQKECTPETLIALVRALLNDPQERALLGQRLHRLILTDGKEKIADIIENWNIAAIKNVKCKN